MIEHCFECDRKLDDQTSMAAGPQPPPRDGDVGICFYCTAVHYFVVQDGEIERRPPTAAEHLELQENASIQHLRAEIRKYWASDYSRR